MFTQKRIVITNLTMKAFIYCRKSTESDDKQVLSIESQLVEAKKLAERHNLNVIETFIEKKSAKTPGRPVFSHMITQLHQQQAQAIICWKLDRLSRNPIDAGSLIWAVEQGKLQKIITYDRIYENNSNDKFLMGLDFTLSKKYIDDLSVNIKRGIETALRRGKWISAAPIGYEWKNNEIILDEKKAFFIQKAYELYSTGKFTVKALSKQLNEIGFRTKSDHKISSSEVHRILTNRFYYGIMMLNGIEYKGNHQPLITPSQFNNIQEILNQRRHGRRGRKAEHFLHIVDFLHVASVDAVSLLNGKKDLCITAAQRCGINAAKNIFERRS